ncbi:MAG: M20/M25/M40 family metallo-hydrolase [Pseudomonadota bacterium]
MAEQHTREAAVDHAEDWVASGEFERELANAVACATESQVPGNAAVLTLYLSDHIAPRLAALGFACEIHDNPVHGAPPLLTAERFESATAPTLLGYGHGDVVRGQHAQWSNGRDPFVLRREGGRLYGRGSADNKAQHLINFAALEAVLRTRGRLGFNARFVVEMGEEVGSPGLSEFFTDNPQLLDADAFIASDGPRLQPDVPTVFLGAPAVATFPNAWLACHFPVMAA